MSKYVNWILLSLNILLFFLFKNENISYWWSTKVLFFINNYGRFFTKPFTFPVGDMMYAILVLNLFFLLFKIIVNFKKKHLRKLWLRRFAEGILFIVLSFQLLWTSQIKNNFIAHYFKLYKKTKIEEYEIKALLDSTVVQLNEISFKRSATLDKEHYKNKCIVTYQQRDTFLVKYNNASVKNSMYSPWLNYMGVSGYYNPLSSEANINKHIPDIIYPYTCCHEIAHQIGFASEDDANFLSYIKCVKDDDINMQYSAQLALYKYTYNRVKRFDSCYAKLIDSNLNFIVKQDIENINTYWKQYDGKIEKVNYWFYNNFMKLFGQKKGIVTYSKMVDLVVLYRRNEIKKKVYNY